ncbi:disulfide bond formation protein DsbA, partial [Pseudomonas paraeruginosa]
MEQKRPSIPMQVQAFRRRHGRPRWPWALAAALVLLLLIWLVSRSLGESPPQSPALVSMTQPSGPPWQMGNPEGRFTLTLYA